MLEYVEQETRVTNEMLDLIASLKMPPTGLNSIYFDEWYRMKTAIEPAVIEKLA